MRRHGGRNGGLAAAAGVIWLVASASALAADAPQAVAGGPPPKWTGSVSANGYLFPGEGDFGLGIARADRGPLHLEARYNYEDRHTGSVWGGWNWSTGDTVKFAITPMLGAVLGDTDAVAPGFEMSIAWRWLDYYLESEIVLDLHSETDDFIYSWSELGVTPVDWLRFGPVGQRTRVYETGLDIQRGIFSQAILGPITLGVYWFNPGGEDAFTVALLDVAF